MTKAGFPGFLCGSAAFLAAFMTTVRADVSIQQKTSLDVASMIRMHGATTTNLTTDKKREDTESHCEGVMSLLCGNLQGGEIVRLDRDVTWHLEPAKKRYREQTFATPEELAAMRAKMQANLEKMRSCPVSQKQQPIDKSGDLKGQPLKTSLRVMIGGQQCKSKAKAADSTGGGTSATEGNPMSDVKEAGKAIGSMMGGLFKKKKADEPQDAAAAPAPAEGSAPDPYSQYVQLASFSMETVRIDTDAIPAARFEIPPDWTKEAPKAAKGGDDEFTCPKS